MFAERDRKETGMVVTENLQIHLHI